MEGNRTRGEYYSRHNYYLYGKCGWWNVGGEVGCFYRLFLLRWKVVVGCLFRESGNRRRRRRRADCRLGEAVQDSSYVVWKKLSANASKQRSIHMEGIRDSSFPP